MQANDSLVQDQYGQISFSNLQTFLQGKVSTYTYAPSYTPLAGARLKLPLSLEDTIRLKPSLELRIGFRARIHQWMERSAWSRLELCISIRTA